MNSGLEVDTARRQELFQPLGRPQEGVRLPFVDSDGDAIQSGRVENDVVILPVPVRVKGIGIRPLRLGEGRPDCWTLGCNPTDQCRVRLG